GDLKGQMNTRELYWSPAQMIAHHTSNGCNLRPGDLLASGTASGPEADARGCLLELRPDGPFLQDGDEVVLRGYAAEPGLPRIGFGECRGTVIAAT
ncbi:MAG TPA: fumarylacetoacetate hydrolase family protein, partial [Bryobacteraceae bacterium]|nr:fumarylacetoacetate hydrolase family protein [Bryobacteraceae bacterium]